jgi:O-antigen/teichoic acid export membrane protein
VVVGAFFAPEWFKLAGRDAATLRWAILWGGIGLFFSYYGQMWNVLAQAHLDFKYLSILRTWTGLASTLGTVGVALLSKNVAVIMAYSTILSLLQFVLLYLRGNNHYKLPLKISHFRKSRLIEMLPYTLKTFAQLISGSLLGSLDRVFLGRLAPATDFAAFNVSQNVSGRIAGLSVAIMGPVFNNTSRGLGGDATMHPKTVYEDSFDFMAKWLGLIIVWAAVWQGPLLEFWLGRERGGLVQASFVWIIAGLCITSLSSISGAQLGSFNKVGASLLFSIATNLVSAALVCAGWFLSGLHGAAIGFFLARTILLLQDAYTRRILGAGYGSKELQTLVFGLTCLALFGLVRFAGHFFNFSLGALVVSAFACGALAAAFILAPYFRRRSLTPTIP